ncbi:MAG: nitric oxide synthase [Chloroflexi bacterium HGW-Chloroflexi-8]|nr:MAG: nitric oxide synthase [Chloroflexi bacterium HGW-Chloroflexi-8]
MKSKLVVFDSVFGNTEKIARAIADSLSSQSEVEVMSVSQVKTLPLNDLKLLIVGSPTRGFKPTPDISVWLAGLPANSLVGVKVAAFDTRIPKDVLKKNFFLRLFSKMIAFAADPIAKELTSKGGYLVFPPEGFIVLESEGPLAEGELQRATDWAANLEL